MPVPGISSGMIQVAQPTQRPRALLQVLMPSRIAICISRSKRCHQGLLCPTGKSGPGFQSDQGGEGWQVHELQVSLVSELQLAKGEACLSSILLWGT